jgi:hypothetical protein
MALSFLRVFVGHFPAFGLRRTIGTRGPKRYVANRLGPLAPICFLSPDLGWAGCDDITRRWDKR